MANATQFIGSKISLISKSEIRYEGILYSLNVVEATISLARGKITNSLVVLLGLVTRKRGTRA